ncbi:Crp/Fnr family transcriptional regulator [Veillonella sp.]|uniref:Crp/Fnr family transcriptional regulator n=1 Tax=Veillonella sp. TaxID=1926307 RepID=UPI0025CC75DB|nr:Crp/Fnr family transcriptional regulator [Veillonella sp.]
MTYPMYFFSEDFLSIRDLLTELPTKECFFKEGAYLWQPGDSLEYLHYIQSGVLQFSINHPTGHEKIISFHGRDTLFPVFFEGPVQLEQALEAQILADTHTIAVKRSDFHSLLALHPEVSSAVIRWYTHFVNLLLYETGHQEYNDGFSKLCNLIYLLLCRDKTEIVISQERLGKILGMSRVHINRYLSRLKSEGIIQLHRMRIEVLDKAGLIAYCSEATVDW